jgi:pimeloyl-ACP methyl ester carboxylesterase
MTLRRLGKQPLLVFSLFLSLCMTIAGCGGGGGISTVPVNPGVAPSLGPIVGTQVAAVNLGSVAQAANLWQPATGSSHVGIVVMHPYSSYKNFMGCSYLAARGFTVLCVDSIYTNNQFGYFGYEQHVPAIAAAVHFLRSKAGITRVLLFGHSAGAPMMTLYENVAENGPGVCSDAAKLSPCVTSFLSDVPPADGVILFDSHIGDSLATFTYVDPAVQNNTLGQRDPTLDMFTAANGYNAATNGAMYGSTFIQTFLAAQAARNALLNQQAQALLAQERQTNPTSLGDDLAFTVVGANNARMWQPDLDLLKCTQTPVTLLSHDGTRPTQIVCSVRPPSGDARDALSSASTLNVNVHIWLGAHAMRTLPSPGPAYNQTNNDITGLDYTSTSTSSVTNITGINRPFLIVANSGHYFLRPDEIIYQTAKMPDKTFAIEEGSVHGGTECTQCETQQGLPTPAPTGAPGPNGTAPPTFGYYGDTFTRTMNFMAEWINRRF